MDNKLYQFRPALLALVHLSKGSMMNFEKHLLADTFYNYFRDLLPQTIEGIYLFSLLGSNESCR